MSIPTINTGAYTARLTRRNADPTIVAGLTACGTHPVAARVLAARCGADAAELATPTLSDLHSPEGLPDIEAGAARLARAVCDGEIIGIVTDHDVDGVTSHAILVSVLTAWFGVPSSGVRRYIGHRLNEGYGLSDSVADRILADEQVPSVIITADCGSSDGPRIEKLADAGIDVIVTDHHELGFIENDAGERIETPPPAAVAVINPARRDSQYGDPLICGAMTTWLVLCATRTRLIQSGFLNQAAPSLSSLLDYVALGTVADCVSLADSLNNRAVVRAGLARMSAQNRACWRVAAGRMGKQTAFGAEDLGFGIGPRINACGRLSDAFAGVRFLLAETDDLAASAWDELDELNNERKEIGKALAEIAQVEAEFLVDEGHKGLAIFLAAGHPGVHGIVASRVLERWGRPVVCLSPHARDDQLITGSARSPGHVHIRDVFEVIHQAHPDLLIAFGGHAAAGGLTIRAENLTRFQSAFAEATASLDASLLRPVIETDGDIDPVAVDRGLIETLNHLEPWGRGFEPVLFEAEFSIMRVKLVGADSNHAQLTLAADGQLFKGIWFFAVTDAGERVVRHGETARLVFTPGLNIWNGQAEVQLQIKGVVR